MPQVSMERLKEIARELFSGRFDGVADLEERDLGELGLDSFAFLQLFAAVEEEFDVDIFGAAAQPQQYRTLAGLLQLSTPRGGGA